MEVRRRTDDDLPTCVDLLRRVHERDRYPTVWPADPADWLKPAGAVGSWVALDEGRIAGHASLARGAEDPGVELVRLFTDPDARGRGVARALVAAGLEHAAANGWVVWLEVVASTPQAVMFYERTGWRRTGTTVAPWTAADGSHPELIRFTQPQSAAPWGRSSGSSR